MSTSLPAAASNTVYVRTRRLEALGLVSAVLTTTVGLLITDAVLLDGGLWSTTPRIVGFLTASALILHLAIRRWARHADPVIAPVGLLLTGLGIIGIHRLDLAEALSQGAVSALPASAWNEEAVAQATWLSIGVALAVALLVLVRDHRRWQRYTWTTMLAGLILLLLPLAPVIGREIRGATLWISIGGLSFQPAEVAKIALTLAFAGYLAIYGPVLAAVRTRALGLPRPRDLGPLLVAWLVSVGVLVGQRDLGTSLLFFGLFVVLLYVATQRRIWPILGAVLFLGGAAMAWVLFDHVQTRVSLWLDPFQGDGTSQVALGLYGMAGGGIFGTGLGGGFPQIVPFAESDFIFATLAEELGITGALAILVLYAILVQRGLRIALAARDSFTTLVAVGLATTIGLQAFIVIGGVTRLIPLTGLTTPFMSAGGSSLIANWIILGILLRMSHLIREERAGASL